MKVSELIQRDKFVTELIDDNHTQNNSKQYESLEISIQNLRNRVNLIDNKSRAKNIMINNVEKSTENAFRLIIKVNQIMHDVDNTIHANHAYRIGQTNKSKPRPIIACLETEKRKYTAVKQAYRLKCSKKFQHAFISEDLCHDFKLSGEEPFSKYKEMKQQYRTVCFKGTELIGKNKKQSAIKSNTPAHSTTVTKLAHSPVPVINKHQPQHSSNN